jgi:hypothetical protein
MSTILKSSTVSGSVRFGRVWNVSAIWLGFEIAEERREDVDNPETFDSVGFGQIRVRLFIR